MGKIRGYHRRQKWNAYESGFLEMLAYLCGQINRQKQHVRQPNGWDRQLKRIKFVMFLHFQKIWTVKALQAELFRICNDRFSGAAQARKSPIERFFGQNAAFDTWRELENMNVYNKFRNLPFQDGPVVFVDNQNNRSKNNNVER